MSSEETGESQTISVPGELRAWLQRAAEERGVSTDEFLRELLTAHRAVDREAVDAPPELVDREELSATREEFTELLEDVRSRVIQVKRETDAKAPLEHDHDELAAEIEAVESDLSTLREALERLQASAAEADALEELSETLEEGFENYEAVLEHLLSATDDLTSRTDRLARAAVANRERVTELEQAVRCREAADRLQRDAARSGITTADCEACGRSVRLALLTAPECPYCATALREVEESTGWFGSATLRTGDRPALAAGEDEDGLAEDLEADRPDPGDVDWDIAGDDG